MRKGKKNRNEEWTYVGLFPACVRFYVMCLVLQRRVGLLLIMVLPGSLLSFVACQSGGTGIGDRAQAFTFYPPSVYMNFFLACSPDKSCTRAGEFAVDPVPKGCCILTVTNGDGRGTDEVSSYEVSLNGERLLPANQERSARIAAKILRHNDIKVGSDRKAQFQDLRSDCL
jgi:hypothetical protein